MMSPTEAPRSDCGSLAPGEIRFYDNYVPTLPVGDYLINVQQRINPAGTSIDERHPASQLFSVQGPRYTLPTEDIHSVFPPNNAEGIFNQFLPHVVLTKRELPWERNVFDADTPERQAPWMALLLFVEGEQIDGSDTLLAPEVPNWKANRTMSAILPAYDLHHHATDDGILRPALEAEWYESEEFLKGTACSVIDISPQAFTALMPGVADLPYLAHVRRVDPTAKESGILKINGEGWYSIVTGSRLPDAPAPGSKGPGRRNIVHLVSLEGFEEYINGSARIPAGTRRVRMISFRSWSFSCLPQMGESFAQSMNGLLRDARGTAKPTAMRLQVPAPEAPTPEESFAYDALRSGYVPLRYHTRPGEQSFAWYRGPFSPVPVGNFVAGGAQRPSGSSDSWMEFGTASGAIIYDKEHGTFDPSYGIAWETGRLMALADPEFGPKLRAWQLKGHYLVDMIMERQHQAAALRSRHLPKNAAADSEDILDLTTPYAMTDDLMVEIIAGFSRTVSPALYGRRALQSDAAPEPASGPRRHDARAYADLHSPAPTPERMAELLEDHRRLSNAGAGNTTSVRDVVRREGTKELEDLVAWLSKLYLLDGVPFESLVPHRDLLPPESVRFFYVDSNWLDLLIEGALSIGVESSRDIFYQKLMSDLVRKATAGAAQQERRALLGSWAPPAAPEAPAFNQETLTGLLLRSSVVSGWPGLEIHAYTRTREGTAEPDLTSHIDLLRMERLGNDVMLCLWPAVPAVVTINEPHEGIAFGFQDPPKDRGNGYYLYLRSLDPAGYGRPLPEESYGIDASKGIIGADRRIRITGAGGLLEAVRSTLPGSPTINVRDLAVQLVKVPETAIFATPRTTEERP